MPITATRVSTVLSFPHIKNDRTPKDAVQNTAQESVHAIEKPYLSPQ
jgi:hypothetical protein